MLLNSLQAKHPNLLEIAEIARLHLATRPFMRYSLHITLCGTIFNICLFDRAGGVVSKDYNLESEDDFKTFIRIIRRATCHMNAYELGLDPTVIPLDCLGSVARYPRFKVKVGDSEYYTRISNLAVDDAARTWDMGIQGRKKRQPEPNT